MYRPAWSLTTCTRVFAFGESRFIITQAPTTTSIVGLVVEFVVAIDEARVRFTDDAHFFLLFFFFSLWVFSFLYISKVISKFCYLFIGDWFAFYTFLDVRNIK